MSKQTVKSGRAALSGRVPQVIAVIALVIALVGLIVVNLPDSNDRSATDATTQETEDEHEESEVPAEDLEIPPVTDVEETAAAETARRFIAAWAQPDLAEQAWFNGIRPYLAAATFSSYEGVDPSEVPSRFVNGEPNVVEATPSQYIVSVPTDTARIRVVINGQFKVTYLEPESSGPAQLR